MKRAMCLKRTNTSAISKNADAIANAGSSGCSRCRILWLIVSYEVMSVLDDISTRGAQIRERLRQLIQRHEYPRDIRSLLLMAYVDIALEHHEAICLLTKSKLNGSAFAMVRPVFDTMFRALWINKVATEQQIEQARRDELTFLMGKIRDDIKQGYFSDRPPEEAQLFDKILQLLKEAWRAMGSYMHSGALQIGRRFIGDELKPNYSEGAIVEAVNLVTIALLLLLHMFFVSMRCQKEDEETQALLRQYRADFGERLRALNTDENGIA